jgi:50S ribosomal protein L16 3-hydroxylase
LFFTPHSVAADALCQHFSVDAEKLGNALEDPIFMAILSELVNNGYWYFND